MSFQAIITCPKPTTTGNAPDAVRMAASTALPEELAAYMRGVASGIGADKNEDYRFYAYRVHTVGEAPYHILFRSILTGNMAGTRLVHALILSQDEVTELRNNAARPTPAGLILALENKLFWSSAPPETEQLADEEPTMTASALPDASTQAAWQQLTGHKGNARALFTPPFDRECLLLMPDGVRQEEVLALFHESDWLTADRGWGRTFTTSGGAADHPCDTQRIAVPASYPLPSVPEWAKLPYIIIDHTLDTGNAPPPLPAAPPPPAAAGGAYTYIESGDNEAYPYKRQPLKRFHRFIITLGGLLALAFCIHIIVYGKVDDAGALASKTIAQKSEPTADPDQPPPPAPIPHPTIDIPEPEQTETEHATTPTAPTPATAEDEQQQESPAQAACQTCLPGQSIPPEYAAALASGAPVRANVYPLHARGEHLDGTLVPTENAGDYLCKDESRKKQITVHIEQDGATLRAISCGGADAAVMLELSGKKLLLAPRLRYVFGEMSVLELPETHFGIKPSQIQLDASGVLRCKSFPNIAEGKLIHLKEPVSIILPELSDLKQTIICNRDTTLPILFKLAPRKTRKGCLTIPAKLLLANPFHKTMPHRFREVTQNALPVPQGTCSCATLFNFAQLLAAGDIGAQQAATYRAWREALAASLPGLPELPEGKPEEHPETSAKIKEAVCDYINRELDKLYRQEKDRAEAGCAPVEMILEELRMEGKNELHWIFTLQKQEGSGDET